VDSDDEVLISSSAGISRVALRWDEPVAPDALVVGDAWERSYGDLQWRHLQPERLLSRYWLAHDPAKVFADNLSGRDVDRPELMACLAYLRIDTTTVGGRLVFHIFAALAEFIRELIVEATHEGLAAAKARGVRLGRPPAMTPDQARSARTLLAEPEHSVPSIAKLLGLSRSTIYKYLRESKGEAVTALPPARPRSAITGGRRQRDLGLCSSHLSAFGRVRTPRMLFRKMIHPMPLNHVS
jgi:predicted DNA-binding transcriptional regulator AlpA